MSFDDCTEFKRAAGLHATYKSLRLARVWKLCSSNEKTKSYSHINTNQIQRMRLNCVMNFKLSLVEQSEQISTERFLPELFCYIYVRIKRRLLLRWYAEYNDRNYANGLGHVFKYFSILSKILHKFHLTHKEHSGDFNASILGRDIIVVCIDICLSSRYSAFDLDF